MQTANTDQTGRIPRLNIWVFARQTCHFVVLSFLIETEISWKRIILLRKAAANNLKYFHLGFAGEDCTQSCNLFGYYSIMDKINFLLCLRGQKCFFFTVRALSLCILHFEPNPIHGEIYSWFFVYIQPKYCFIWNHCIALRGKMHAFCMMSFSVVLRVKIRVNTPDSQLDYTFVQLTAGYKTSLNVEISCVITVRRRVNYGNLMNIFVYRNQFDYYSLSSTFPSMCRPSTQVYRIVVMK